jgi:hypothetical protein
MLQTTWTKRISKEERLQWTLYKKLITHKIALKSNNKNPPQNNVKVYYVKKVCLVYTEI